MGNKQSRRRRIPNNSVAPMHTQEPLRRIPNNSVAPIVAQESRVIQNDSIAPMYTQEFPRLIPNNSVAPIDTQQPPRRVPKIQFRVLIIGRANAGKTSILQRVCDTTESAVIFRGNKEVKLDPSMERGEHTIDDELVFSNHRGYIFHDSRGIESGSTEELEILWEFIRRKCGEKRLRSRLHAIWYCVPMDNQRPQLDLKIYKDICPDQNVPVIVVFTKHDQFLVDVAMHMDDYPNVYSGRENVSEVAEKRFQERYLHPLGDDIRFVRLQKMHMQNSRCDDLIERTAAALNEDIVALMLFTAQRDNLQLGARLSVQAALNRVNPDTGSDVQSLIRKCLLPFPYIWLFPKLLSEEEAEFSFEFLLEEEEFLELPESSSLSEFRFLEMLSSLENSIRQIMSLPSIQTLSINGLGHWHLILGVIFILKHATFLRLSGLSSESALTHADKHYHEANINLKIQEYLAATSTEQSATQFSGFIMATEIESTQPDI